MRKRALWAVIRSNVGGTVYGDDGDTLIEPVIRTAALTMSDPADLINVAIETLMQSNVELPAYRTLDRLVGHVRHQVHESLCHSITADLSEAQGTRLATTRDELAEMFLRWMRKTRYAAKEQLWLLQERHREMEGHDAGHSVDPGR